MSFRDDMKLEHKWREPIKQALAAHFGCDPQDFIRNHTLDLFGSADLVLGRTEDRPQMRIPLRVRRGAYLKYYSDEFTLRLSRPDGRATEWEKVKAVVAAGKEVRAVYAIETVNGTGISVAHFIDLNTLVKSGEINRYTTKQNDDGSSEFACFKLTQAPHSVMIVEAYEEDACLK